MVTHNTSAGAPADVSVSLLFQMVRYLSTLEVDSDEIFRAHGVDPEILRTPDAKRSGVRQINGIYPKDRGLSLSIRCITFAGVNAKTGFPAGQPDNRTGGPFAIIPVPEIIGAYFFVGGCFG